MFNKEQNSEIKDVETIIGPSIKVKGNFHGNGNMIIEGVVDGSVKTNNHLLIGNKAKIIANIEAKDAKIGGQVNGNIKVQGYLEIIASAKVFGDVEASSISVEKGAILNGKCTMVSGNTQSKEKSE